MSQETKKPAPKPKKKLVLKKNYVEFGKTGDPVTPEMEKAIKAKKIPVSAVAE